MAIKMKHTTTNLVKSCPEGFSATFFFFGPLVGMLRGMWTPAIISMCTFGLGNLYYMFSINKKYVEHLMERGFVPDSQVDRQKIVSLGLLAKQDSSTEKISA